MNLDSWLTLDELAAFIKISRAKIYQMSQKAEIPASKIGNQWRFNRQEIDIWMKSQRPSKVSSQQKEKVSSKEVTESE